MEGHGAGWVHGESEFRARMLDHLRKDSVESPKTVYDAQQKRDLTEAAIEKLIRRGLNILGVRNKDLRSLFRRQRAVRKLSRKCWMRLVDVPGGWSIVTC